MCVRVLASARSRCDAERVAFDCDVRGVVGGATMSTMQGGELSRGADAVVVSCASTASGGLSASSATSDEQRARGAVRLRDESRAAVPKPARCRIGGA
jgi:hypothetical protein